jgi:hypothetical protein
MVCAMATTDGMGGDYGEHSEYQQRVAETGAALVEACVGALDLPQAPEPLVLMDLGSATGRNSLATMATAVRAARGRTPDGPILCIHNDLLTNDWTALFSALAAASDGYLAVPGGRIIPMAAAGTFFEPTVPAAFAHLQMSFNAAHWLREPAAAAVPEGMYFSDATGRARAALAAQAADDWAAFVAARAADLRPDGRLLVQCVGTHVDAAGRELVTARELLSAMWAVAVELADEGVLEMGAVERFVFPVYARTAEEARVPFEGPESAFEVVELSVAPVANPYLDAWHADGNIDAYARSYTAFVRGFAESALRRGLLGDTTQADAAERLADEYFRRLEDHFRQHPEADAFRDWTLTVVARRR